MNTVPVSSLRGLLKYCEKIDPKRAVLQSAFCRIPSKLYSFKTGKPVQIRTASMLDSAFLSPAAMAKEYSTPVLDPPSLQQNLSAFIEQNETEHVDERDVSLLKEQLKLLSNAADDTAMVRNSHSKFVSPFEPEERVKMLTRIEPWRRTLLVQHPMSCINGNTPALILGLDYYKDDLFSSVMLNRKSMLELGSLLQYDSDSDKHFIITSHGKRIVPELFHSLPVFHGGDSTDHIDVISVNELSRGISLFNGHMFWNSNLEHSANLIKLGYAKVEDFKFIRGKTFWTKELLENAVHDRNIFSAFMMEVTRYSRMPVLDWMADAILASEPFEQEDSISIEQLQHTAETDEEQWEKVVARLPAQFHNWIGLRAMIRSRNGSNSLRQIQALHQRHVTAQVSESFTGDQTPQ